MSSQTRIASLRHAFLSGLLLVAPLVVTVWAFGKIIDLVGGNFRAIFFFYVPEEYLNAPRLVLLWDILGTAIAVVVVLVVTVARKLGLPYPIVLVAAGLFAERLCMLPPDDGDKEPA